MAFHPCAVFFAEAFDSCGWIFYRNMSVCRAFLRCGSACGRLACWHGLMSRCSVDNRGAALPNRSLEVVLLPDDLIARFTFERPPRVDALPPIEVTAVWERCSAKSILIRPLACMNTGGQVNIITSAEHLNPHGTNKRRHCLAMEIFSWDRYSDHRVLP